jgi:hypothetical protein
VVEKLTLFGVEAKPRELVDSLSFLVHTRFYKSFRNLFLEAVSGGWSTRRRITENLRNP